MSLGDTDTSFIYMFTIEKYTLHYNISSSWLVFAEISHFARETSEGGYYFAPSLIVYSLPHPSSL